MLAFLRYLCSLYGEFPKASTESSENTEQEFVLEATLAKIAKNAKRGASGAN